MNTHVRALAIVLLAVLVSSCAPSAGTTAAAPRTPGPGASALPATGASPGATPTDAAAQPVVDEEWPHEVSSGGDRVTVYQPQVDTWDGAVLRAHAAVAVKTSDEKTPPTF